MRTALLTIAVLASVSAAACAETPNRPLNVATSPAGAAGDAAPRIGVPGAFAPGAQGLAGAPITAGSIRIDERILRACGNLPIAHFTFDSAAISGEAADMLGRLAACFVSGPLAGHAMRLVGHADPRGEVTYNLALGQQRAGSVALFLAQRGVAQDRVGTMSKGEFEATGYDEVGWAEDRRVEVFLADAGTLNE